MFARACENMAKWKDERERSLFPCLSYFPPCSLFFFLFRIACMHCASDLLFAPRNELRECCWKISLYGFHSRESRCPLICVIQNETFNFILAALPSTGKISLQNKQIAKHPKANAITLWKILSKLGAHEMFKYFTQLEIIYKLLQIMLKIRVRCTHK